MATYIDEHRDQCGKSGAAHEAARTHRPAQLGAQRCDRPASKGDITGLGKLLHGQERGLFADQDHFSEDHRQHCHHGGIRYRVNREASPRRALT
jgi:hypothetical protein